MDEAYCRDPVQTEVIVRQHRHINGCIGWLGSKTHDLEGKSRCLIPVAQYPQTHGKADNKETSVSATYTQSSGLFRAWSRSVVVASPEVYFQRSYFLDSFHMHGSLSNQCSAALFPIFQAVFM